MTTSVYNNKSEPSFLPGVLLHWKESTISYVMIVTKVHNDPLNGRIQYDATVLWTSRQPRISEEFMIGQHLVDQNFVVNCTRLTGLTLLNHGESITLTQ